MPHHRSSRRSSKTPSALEWFDLIAGTPRPRGRNGSSRHGGGRERTSHSGCDYEIVDRNERNSSGYVLGGLPEGCFSDGASYGGFPRGGFPQDRFLEARRNAGYSAPQPCFQQQVPPVMIRDERPYAPEPYAPWERAGQDNFQHQCPLPIDGDRRPYSPEPPSPRKIAERQALPTIGRTRQPYGPELRSEQQDRPSGNTQRQSDPQLFPLPRGWEMRRNEAGRVYFLNKDTNTTTFDHPWLSPTVNTRNAGVPEKELCAHLGALNIADDRPAPNARDGSYVSEELDLISSLRKAGISEEEISTNLRAVNIAGDGSNGNSPRNNLAREPTARLNTSVRQEMKTESMATEKQPTLGLSYPKVHTETRTEEPASRKTTLPPPPASRRISIIPALTPGSTMVQDSNRETAGKKAREDDPFRESEQAQDIWGQAD